MLSFVIRISGNVQRSVKRWYPATPEESYGELAQILRAVINTLYTSKLSPPSACT